jgi:probable addiction module antidote protein
MRDKSHDSYMIEEFRRNPKYALEFLNEVLADGDLGEFQIALGQYARAMGGVAKVAGASGMNRTQVYRTLSSETNPGIDKIAAVMRGMSLRLRVERIPKKRA